MTDHTEYTTSNSGTVKQQVNGSYNEDIVHLLGIHGKPTVLIR